MPVKITIEDPDKWRRMGKSFDGDAWKEIVTDFASAVAVTDAGARLLEDGTPRYLETGQPRNLE